MHLVANFYTCMIVKQQAAHYNIIVLIHVHVGGMLIYIRMQTGKTIPLIVKPSDTIESVKDRVHEIGGIRPDSQRLVTQYGGKELDNGRTLSDYHIGEESIIYNVLNETKGKYIAPCPLYSVP